MFFLVIYDVYINAVLVSLHAKAELMHHTEHLGVYLSCRVVMMLECSYCKSHLSAEFMDYNNKVHSA